MRWIITDRVTGEVIVANQPQNKQEIANLKAVIRQRSVLGQRGGCLNDL